MKPYLLTLPIVILLSFSCKNLVPVHTALDTAKIVAKDTTAANEDDEVGYPTKYIEHARLEGKDRTITLTSRFAVVDGKVDEEDHYDASSNYFVYVNKKTGKADTLKAGLDNLGGCPACKFFIRDMTDSFQLNTPVVQIVTPAEDIYYTSSFVGYQNGKFQKLFTLDDSREEGIVLHRAGSKLIGCIAGRDEVVDNLEDDYRVEIDTKTFEVTNIRPAKQYIGWATTATQSFRAHPIIGGQVDSSLVAVKAGAEVTVDTLYRSLGKVRLRVRDSVVVEVRLETATKKLDHNHAG
jgi:hypothetical protein